MGKSFFVTGIDTDAGKTYATAWLAGQLMAKGLGVITQKFIQTGCNDESEDIVAHRRLMGVPMQDVDRQKLTAPVIFSYPASAQLAARVDGRQIDLSVIDDARHKLEEIYDVVLVEGAGGLMVPITDNYFAIDYAADRHLPIWLVTNARLGSINHTVLSLNEILRRGLALEGILYNTHFDTDPVIAPDTRAFITRYVHTHFSPSTPVLTVPNLTDV